MALNAMPLDKQSLRMWLREERRAHVAALPSAVRALIFSRPPAAVTALLPQGAVVGLYHAAGPEAPTLGYARWLHENGYPLALPWFPDKQSAMTFRVWADPYDDHALTPGPHGALQPVDSSLVATPKVVFVPLIGFTIDGSRLGQGGGHYDRWLDAHPHVPAIGLAWDCQMVEAIPMEPHDRAMSMVVTPTCIHHGSN